MTAATPFSTPHLDAGLRLCGVLLRAAAYALLASFASHYDCGRVLLLGLLVGDLAASVVTLAWRWVEERRQAVAEFAALLLVLLWVRQDLVWPQDPAERAILGLAAFGVFVGRAGGTALTRLGPSENGFS